MSDKITTASIATILTMVLFTSSFSATNADPQSDFDNCPPPEGVFVRITVFGQDGSEEGTKTFSAKSYSTSKTTEGGTGTVSKFPDEHSQQLNDSVGKSVTIEIVDCRDVEPPYRDITTLTGGTIDSFSQSGSSGPPVETITFSIFESEVEYTEKD